MSAEIMTTASAAALQQMDPSVREEAVTRYLEHARDQLTLAVNLSGPEAVAAMKAEIATAAEATKQLGLSKEIQADAQEMVRRAEYALGKAIRAGQSVGDIAVRGQVRNYKANGLDVQNTDIQFPTDFATMNELSGDSGNGIYALVDGVTEPEFEAALADAREEGNVSRANVVRKIKGVKAEGLTPLEKLVKIRELAPDGMASSQIAKELGISEEYVRKVARDNGIEIAADKAVSRSRRVDSNQIIAGTVEAAAIPTSALELVAYGDLDRERLGEWISSLSESIRTLRALRSRLEKELNQ